MALETLNKDLDIVQKLSTYPNQENGLSAEELKATFDEGAKIIKEYLNSEVVRAVNAAVTVEPQEFTPEQQAQARKNIGAAAVGEGGGSAEGAVLYTPQQLDEAKKMQARKNIGVDAGVEGAIPAAWQTELDKGVLAINSALCDAGANKSAFLFYTDVHWQTGTQWDTSSKLSPKLLKYLYYHTGMTKTIFGGDIVEKESQNDQEMAYLWEWRREVKDLPNHHSVVGNHDDGNNAETQLSEQFVYGYLFAPEETCDIVRGEGSTYYYIDSPAEKTRYLYLDTGFKDQFALSAGQADFVKEALISTKDGWHIVAIAHIWNEVKWGTTGNEGVGALSAPAQSLVNMFDSYNSRNGEYANCGGKVEFCIGGHVHRDNVSTSATGIPIIITDTDSYNVVSGVTISRETDKSCISGIIADYDNHKITVVRIGRGESREIEVSQAIYYLTNIVNGGISFKYPYYYSSETAKAVYKEFDIFFETGYEYTIKVDTNLTGLQISMRVYPEDVYNNKISQELEIGSDDHTGILSWTETAGGVTFKIPSDLNNCVGYFFFRNYVDGTAVDFSASEIKSVSIYREVSVNYTNLLPTALDRRDVTKVLTGTDGSIGYLNSKHYASSAATYVDDSIWDTTGLIPCTVGDIVRLKNIDFRIYTTSEASSSGNHGGIIWLKADGTILNSSVPADKTQAELESGSVKYVFDSDGKVVQFTTPAWIGTECAYVQITAFDIKPNSIVTVNEVIE